jgi:ABC1 atypical kinase-like domain
MSLILFICLLCCIKDPHPGNFMVTPEGKLVILDYGLMTEVWYSTVYSNVSSTQYSIVYSIVSNFVTTHCTWSYSCLLGILGHNRAMYHCDVCVDNLCKC